MRFNPVFQLTKLFFLSLHKTSCSRKLFKEIANHHNKEYKFLRKLFDSIQIVFCVVTRELKKRTYYSFIVCHLISVHFSRDQEYW